MTSGHDSTASLVTGGGKPPGPPHFGAGDLLAGRYKVVRFIAEGGMGEVYEAEDLALGERVALKTVRPDVAGDGKAIERFKREIQLARKVTHHNVCRIFDVGFHKDHDREITFLTMELLAGQTLASRLRERGPLSVEEARPLVEQMATALAAAHDAGVIHRDFKSANVILVGGAGDVPAPATASQSGQHARAVVTDFGLARAAAGGDAGITGAGGIVGSPAYMAPEQVEGGQIGAAADVYALGVVMYEMMTGEVPFRGDTPLATAVSRLKEPAPSPRKQVPALPRAWERAILRCLSRRPQDRFASVRDVLTALDDGSRSGSRSSTGVRAAAGSPAWLKPALYAGAAALVGLAFVAWFVKGQGGKEKRPPPAGVSPAEKAGAPAAVPEKRTLAVMGFKDLSGAQESAWMSGALAELFATELGAGEGARVVATESVSRARRSLDLPANETYAADTLAKLKQALGADYVVTGTYMPSGGKIRLDLRVQDTVSGETASPIVENGDEKDLVALVVRSSSRVRAQLGLDAPTPAEAAEIKAALPSNTDAARLYAEGYRQLRNYECLAARDLLERAVTADPKHAQARSALGETLHCLGFEKNGTEEMARAVSLAAKLPAIERMRIEARQAMFSGQLNKAADIYRKIYEADPKDVEAGVQYVQMLMKANEQDRAEKVLHDLLALEIGGEDMRLAQLQITMLARRNKLPEALAETEKAEQVARSRGERAALALILYGKSELLAGLGEFKGAIDAAAASNVESVAVGDRDGVCMGDIQIGRTHMELGQHAAAQVKLEDALALGRELGSMRRVRDALGSLADLAERRGDLGAAERYHEERVEMDRGLGERRGVAWSLGELGTYRLMRGDLAGARKLWQEAEASYGDELGAKMVQTQIAMLETYALILEGDMGGARALADATFPKTDDDRPRDWKHAWLELTVRAELALEDGRPLEAEQAIRKMHEQLTVDRRSRIPELGFLDLLLARALFEQGKLEEAKELLERVTALADRSSYAMLQLEVALGTARFKTLPGKYNDVGGARKLAEKALRDASRFGFVPHEMEARLVLGELARRVDAADGRARLMQLEKDAKAKGLGLYVRKAASSRT